MNSSITCDCTSRKLRPIHIQSLVFRHDHSHHAGTSQMCTVSCMAKSIGRDRFFVVAKTASRLAAHTTAVFTAVAVLLIGGWLTIYLLYPSQTIPWYVAITLFPLTYCTVFLLNPKGTRVQRIFVMVILFSLTVWYTTAGGGIIGYTVLVTTLSAIPHVVQDRKL